LLPVSKKMLSHPVVQITPRNTVGRRTPAARGESVARAQQILHCHFGYRQFPCNAVGPTHDVAQGDAVAPGSRLRRLDLTLGLWLERGQRGCVLQAEVAKRGQLHAAIRPQTGGMSWRGERRVVRRGRQRVVRECGGGGSRRHGRVGPRSLGLPVCVCVMVVMVVVRVRTRHVVRPEPKPEPGQRIPRRVQSTAIIGVLSRWRVVVGRGHVVPCYLTGRPCKHGHVRTALAAESAAVVRTEVKRRGKVVGAIVRRRHIGRRKSRGRRRADDLGLRGRRHNVVLHPMHHSSVLRVALVPSPRVWIAVYPRVPRQLV
jgi:hypothetical protein